MEISKLFIQCYMEIRIFNIALRFRNYESAKYAHERLIYLFGVYNSVLKLVPEIEYVLYEILDMQDWVLPKMRKYIVLQDIDVEEREMWLKHYENGIRTAMKILEGILQKRYLDGIDKLLNLYPEVIGTYSVGSKENEKICNLMEIGREVNLSDSKFD